MHTYTKMLAETLYINVCKGGNVGRRNCLSKDILFEQNDGSIHVLVFSLAS